VNRVAATIALAIVCALGSPAAASPYSDALLAAARSIDHAANARAPLPVVHVPPAPLGGPPQYSPSVDDWLQGCLAVARREHNTKRRAADLRSIAASLRFLAEESGRAGGSQPGDTTGLAKQILSENAYRAARTTPAPEPQETWWQRFLEWVFDQLGKLFGGLAQATVGTPWVGRLIAVVLIALAVAGLLYVAYRLAQGFAIRRRADAGDGELLPVRGSADELYAAAQEAQRSGQYARAIALLFHASLVLLDRADRVNYDPARTAGEYRRAVRRNAQHVAVDFDALARIFTLAAYADAPVGPPDWSAAEASYRTIAPALGAT